jgi:hypothetical protein
VGLAEQTLLLRFALDVKRGQRHSVEVVQSELHVIDHCGSRGLHHVRASSGVGGIGTLIQKLKPVIDIRQGVRLLLLIAFRFE